MVWWDFVNKRGGAGAERTRPGQGETFFPIHRAPASHPGNLAHPPVVITDTIYIWPSIRVIGYACALRSDRGDDELLEAPELPSESPSESLREVWLVPLAALVPEVW